MFLSSDPAIPQARSDRLATENRTANNGPRSSSDEARSSGRLGSVQQQPGRSVMPSEWLEQELIDKSRHPSDNEAGHIDRRGESSYQSWQQPDLHTQETAQQGEENPRENRLEITSQQLTTPLYDPRLALPEQKQADASEPAHNADQAYNIRTYYARGLDSFLQREANRQTVRSDIDSLFESSDVEGDNSMLQQPSEPLQHHGPIPGLFDHRPPPQHAVLEALSSNDDLFDESGHILPEISSRLKQNLESGVDTHIPSRDIGWHHPAEPQAEYRQFGLNNDSSAETEPFGPPRESLSLGSYESATAKLVRADVQADPYVSAYHDNRHSLDSDDEAECEAQFHWLSCGCAVGHCHCESPSMNDTDEFDRHASSDRFRTDPRPSQPTSHAASSHSTGVGSASPQRQSAPGTTSIAPSRADTPRPPTEDRVQPPFIIYDLDNKILTTVEGEAYEETIAGSVSQGVGPVHHGERSSTPSPTSAGGRYPPVPGWDHESVARCIEREISVPPPEREMAMPARDRDIPMPPPDREVSVPRADVEMSVTESVVFGVDKASEPPVERPNVPPIPHSTGPLKQPKRGERRKSAVQGAKVDKRSVTGTSKQKPRSRNVTRKPTAAVGKLVEQAKKLNKLEASDGVADGDGLDHNKPQAGGKVAAAVNKIEKQVMQQEETKHLKQKDGTPVRRSQRVNKAVRTSVP
ncbi:hypothetical protein LTR10_017227 [Elasticomyces elasticus]|uniref:Uncharacterized protein n=1 Tax=Exophiala sideris TaxID=1016849 RepID=A0ABR0J5R7_9EURO|nr:hypothetical protein LTR10_017227 [Elasticomyces elasticus]KAK5028417.1 hypothetical protein LTS07_006508 [Exophiala sideris]KAK5035940.1 hypothetical protein LTR13_005510 [Exophiala sideris]KAK5056976.1 hypothetical protein LTR69_007614 [Exophiala sideris]KAK5181383.1 hypothetical protein LTR44_006178 [Eurotiomycetes sp. CCFEE 6388]